MSAEVLAVDIGGTKMAAAWVAADASVRDHQVVPTPPAESGEPKVPWQALAGLLDQLLLTRPDTVLGIAISTAGPLNLSHGTVSPVNIPAWRDFPLVDEVRQHVPGVVVRVAGDGICAAIGEHWAGAGRHSQDMLGAVVSTGVGGGLILGGRVHAGRTGNAGHIGHVVVDVDGEPCACGGIGCVEAIASGPRLVRWALANGWNATSEATARELAAAAAQSDPVALAAFDRAGRALAAAFVSTAVTCDIGLIVVGGGVSRAGDLLFEPIRTWIKRLGWLDFVQDLTVVPATLADKAGLVGAAALIVEPDRYAGAST